MKEGLKKVGFWGLIIIFPFVGAILYTKQRTKSLPATITIGVITALMYFSLLTSKDISVDQYLNEINSRNDQIFELSRQLESLTGDIDNKNQEIKDLNKELDSLNIDPIISTDTPNKTKEKKKEYIFSSGNYISGKDFEPGNYDIIAISGNTGNVSSDNMYTGGINAIMGLDKTFAEKEYKNIELPKDTKLSITNVKIKLIKVE